MRSAVRSATVAWRQRRGLPQMLVFFVTSRCNARCDFCLYWDQINDPVPRSRELTVAEVEQIAASYGPLNYLALSGGEPFVRKDIAPLCQAFVDRCGTAVVDIPSNFWFTDTMVESLGQLAADNPDLVVDVQLSLDHLGARHDESRKVAGLFDRALVTFAALDEVRARHPNLKLKVNIVWLPSNWDDLDEIVRGITTAVRPDRVQIAYPNVLLPAAWDPATATDADVRAFVETARRLGDEVGARGGVDLHTLGVRATKPVYHRMLLDAATATRATGDYCEAGRNVVVLDEKGEVFPCEPLWSSVGNVRDHGYDLGVVLGGAAMEEFRSSHLGGGRCNCTWSCAMLAAVSVSPRLLPEVGRNAVAIAVGDLRRRRAAESIPEHPPAVTPPSGAAPAPVSGVDVALGSRAVRDPQA